MLGRWPSWTNGRTIDRAAPSARPPGDRRLHPPVRPRARPPRRGLSVRPTTLTQSRTTASTSVELDGLVKYLLDVHEPFAGYQRHVTTQNIELDGDEAHAESYFLSVIRVDGSPKAAAHRWPLRRPTRAARPASGGSPTGCRAGVVRRDAKAGRSIRRCRSRRASTATMCRTPARCT